MTFFLVVVFIEESAKSEENIVFRLSDLKNMFCDCIINAGGHAPQYIHSSRFAEKLVNSIPSFEAHVMASGTVMSFKTKPEMEL